MIIDKKKQKEGVFQDKEVFLCKPYAISLKSSRPSHPELFLLKKEVNNLEKALKTSQSPMKTILFFSSAHYKTILTR